MESLIGNNIVIRVILITSLITFSFSCSSKRIQNKVNSYMQTVNLKLNNGDSFIIAEYFTESGWNTIKWNFDSDEEFQVFMNFLSNQEVFEIDEIDENSFQVLLGEYNESGTYIGLVFKEESGKLKIDKYIAGK